ARVLRAGADAARTRAHSVWPRQGAAARSLRRRVAASVMSEPAAHERATLLLGLYAFTLRFYLDFAGYSDVAIGLGALFGYEIQENFDRPLVQRNLVLLWQRWHMTLTRWLRTYVFIPLSRSFMRREWVERTSVAASQAE